MNLISGLNGYGPQPDAVMCVNWGAGLAAIERAAGTALLCERWESGTVCQTVNAQYRTDSDFFSLPSVVPGLDRKSTRLNSSHGYISYAVFCLKKKKNI